MERARAWIPAALAAALVVTGVPCDSSALSIRNRVIFAAPGGNPHPDSPPESFAGPVVFSQTYATAAGGMVTVTGSASASSLGTTALARVETTGMVGGNVVASAQTIFEDLFFEGPDAFVSSPLNMHLSGRLSPLDGDPTNEFSLAIANVQISLTLFDGETNEIFGRAAGFLMVDSATWYAFPGRIVGDQLVIVEHTGLLNVINFPASPLDVELELNTAAFLDVPTGIPLSLLVRLQVFASGTDGGTTIPTDSLSDFSTTFTFPSSGPVFDLPPGFTMNSVEANIVDNVWLPEPELDAITLFVLSLLGRGLGQRRERAANGVSRGQARLGRRDAHPLDRRTLDLA